MIDIRCGDCLELMQTIPDKSIDLILCDPPYGTTACKWDKVIDFQPMWNQYKRIIKDRSAILIFGCEPFSSYLRTSNIAMYKYDWIWRKKRCLGFFNAKNKPLNDHEIISVFSFGTCANRSDNLMTYNPQGVIHSWSTARGRKNSKTDSDGHRFFRKNRKEIYTKEFTNYPKQILEFNSEFDTVHPTQKPVLLLEYLIKTYTSEGSVVLDNCMGSGSTGVACVNTNRNFIGFELTEKYFSIAKERIEKAQEEYKFKGDQLSIYDMEVL